MIFFTAVACYMTIFVLFIILSIYDYKYYILPNKLNFILALACIGFHIATRWALLSPLDALLGGVTGSGLLLMLRALANRFYDEDALGLGDVKLVAAAGLGLGFPDILPALSLGASFGLLHGMLMGWRQKRAGASVDFARVNVPAGLGLCLGIAIVMAFRFGAWWSR